MTRTEGPAADRGSQNGVQRFRERVRATRGGRLGWRIVISVLGVAVIIIGVVLLPLPGPGWLIIFAGLGILATEFEWASRLLARARAFVRQWTSWVQARSRPVQVLIGLVGIVLLAAVVLGVWELYR